MKATLLKPRPKAAGNVDGVVAPFEPRSLWTTMPGWCTAADLIPPELLNARRVKVLRNYVAGAVVLVLLVCAGGYYLAARDNGSAAADLASEQDRTLFLVKQSHSYSGVVAIQGSITLVQTQVAQVMVGDVDLVALMGKLQSSLPKTMTINQESIIITPVGAVDPTATAAGLDTSGLPRIGTITLSGAGRSLDDLSDYVDHLRAVTGLVDIVPVSNTKSTSGAGTQYNLQIGMTNQLLSHRFDVVPVTK